MQRKSVKKAKVYPALICLADDGRSVRIADIVMDCHEAPGPWTPKWSDVRDLVLDQPTSETLRFLARGLSCDANVLLEGETGTSKSAAVMYLATLTRSELMRISLNGQTDAGELVGRFMPNPDSGLSRADLEPHRQHLRPETRKILDEAAATGREIGKVDRLRVTSLEGWPPTVEQPWVFNEGLVVQALRRGAWVLLDEVNLAETSILERINSVLDQPRSLVLTEHDGTRFGLEGGVPIAPGFRILATMNPAEYAGRGRLSEAFVNRWTLVRAVRRPAEADFRALVHGLVLGEIPIVEVAGQCWRGFVEAPDGYLGTRKGYDSLRGLADVETALDGLAVFHSKMVTLCSDTGQGTAIGEDRRQGYSYTRRDLITTLDLMERIASNGVGSTQDVMSEAIEWVYLQRISDDADRARVRDLMDVLALDSVGTTGVTPALLATLKPAPTWQSWSAQLARGSAAEFGLTLEAGQEVELTTSPPHGAAERDTVLELRDAESRLVARDDDGGEGLTSHLQHRITAGGDYTARLLHVGRVAGSYRLAYRASGSDGVTQITPAGDWQTVADRLSKRRPRGERKGSNDYVVEAETGDVFDFSTSPSTGGGMAEFDSTLEVCDPSGDRLAFNDDGGDGQTSVIRAVRTNVAGPHVVRVAAYRPSEGDFRLAYRRTPAAEVPSRTRSSRRSSASSHATGESIRLTRRWKRVSGTLTRIFDDADYTFNGTAGQSVVFSTSPTDGSGSADFDTVIDLFGPDGSLLCSDDDGGEGETSVLRADLTSDGDYTVRVRPWRITSVVDDLAGDDDDDDDDEDDHDDERRRTFTMAYKLED